VAEPAQTAVEYRRMLAEVRNDYLEFSRPPYAVDPLDERLVKQARVNGVSCRLLIETGTLDESHRTRLSEYAAAGVEIRQAPSLPLKLALFDGQSGLDRASGSRYQPAGLDPRLCSTIPAWARP
jgi:hypothetical protein